jgi:hypothetical protein
VRFLLRFAAVVFTLIVATFPAKAQFSVNLPIKEVSVKNVEGTAVFSGGDIDGKPGRPALPFYNVLFLLPPDADLKTVSVSISGLAEKEVSGTFKVNPIPLPDRKNKKLNWALIDQGRDKTVYTADEFFPQEYKKTALCAAKRQYKMAKIAVFPFRYNPVTGKLRALTAGSLNISFSSAGNSDNASSSCRSACVEKTIENIVVNPSVFQTYGAPENVNTASVKSLSAMSAASSVALTPVLVNPPPSIPNHLYIVLTTNAIKTAILPELTDFLNRTVVANLGTFDIWTVEGISVSGYTGQDRTEKIYDYISARYRPQVIYNLLIIGNPDVNNGDIPMRLTDGMPNDFYYSEYTSDFQAEINVGRLPVVQDGNASHTQASLDSIKKILTRTADYCQIQEDDAEGRRSVLIPVVSLGHNGAPTQNFQSFGQDSVLRNFNNSQTGWKVRRLYDPYDYLQCYLIPEIVRSEPFVADVPYCNYFNVASEWNNYKPGLVFYNTHGCPSHAIEVVATELPWSVPSLKPDYPAMVYAASCETGVPAMGDGQFHLPFQILCRNAVAYIGASVEIFPATGELMGKELALVFSNNYNNYSSGEVVSQAKFMSAIDDNDWPPFCFNLWGCPNASMNLKLVNNMSFTPPVLTRVKANFGEPNTRIEIAWQDIPNATAYIIQRGAANATRNSPASDWQTAQTVYRPATSWINTGLTPGQKYKFRICAINANGRSGFSVIDSAATYLGNAPRTPSAPTLASIAIGDSKAELSWTPSPGLSYLITRATTQYGTFSHIAYTDQSPFKDTNLVNGFIYWYKIKAVNNYGQSDFSNAVSAAPLTPATVTAPSNLSISIVPPAAPDFLPTKVNYTWNCNADNAMGAQFLYSERLPDGTYGAFIDYVAEPLSYGGVQISGREQTQSPNFSANGSFITREMRGNGWFKFAIRNFSRPDGTIENFNYSQPAYDPNEYYVPGNSLVLDPAAPVLEIDPSVTVLPEQVAVKWSYSHFLIGASYKGFQVYTKKDLGPWMMEDFPSITTLSAVLQIGANTTYNIAVRATHTEGDNQCFYSNYSNVLTNTTPYDLAAPIIKPPYLITNKSIRFYIDNQSVSAEEIQLERKIGAGSFTVYKHLPPNTRFYLDENLDGGKLYTYRARVYNSTFPGTPNEKRFSAYSADYSATTFTTAEFTMGFEEPTLWSFVEGSGTLTKASKKTQGKASIKIEGNGWQKIKCVNLKTTEINETSSALKFDLYIGATQPNPDWVGQTQLTVNCPSAGIYNRYIGAVELRSLPRDVFSTITFTLPSAVMNVLAGNYSDFSFAVSLNTNAGSGPYYIDNMRF